MFPEYSDFIASGQRRWLTEQNSRIQQSLGATTMTFSFIFVVLIALFISGQSTALVSSTRLTAGGRTRELHHRKNVHMFGKKLDTGTEIALFASGTKDASDGTGLASGAFKWYNNKLEKHPMVTKIVSSGVIGGMSDLLIQALSNKGALGGFDLRRSLVFSVVCAFYFAPVVNAWFTLLSKIPFPAQLSDTGKVIGMVAIDQTVGNAIVSAGFFYAFEIAQRLIPPASGGLDAASILAVGNLAVQRNLLTTMQASWCYWPFINFINFRFVPLQYRVLFSNVASVFWNMYLTCVANA